MSKTFLGSLARDVRGNTLAIMAIALIPMMAMIGSGIDMTRAYMAQNRLRQACDAGSLAGRRLLSGTTITDAVRDETTKYFQFNFSPGQFQTAPYTLNISAPSIGTLHVETETTMPTSIMKMFGFTSLPLSTSCSATQDFVSTDIMMVFDLSGSMNCPPNTPNSNCGNINQSGSKLDALKSGAIALYDVLESAQNQLADNNLRLRYGFVNYSNAVNVGASVYSKNPDYFVKNWTYQSRLRAEERTGQSQSWCNTRSGYYYVRWEGRRYVYACLYPSTNGSLWLYRPVTHDTTNYLSGGTPFLQSRGANSSAWAGCIEERNTDATEIDGGAATYPPTSALDLDIDLIPNNDASRWRPAWPDTEFNRSDDSNGSLATTYCPTAARRLRTYNNDRSGFEGYVNGLTAIGSTYHDIGIIWGARFISQDGIFAASPANTNDNNVTDNPKTIRGFSVKKYMIFMTDGDMQPSNSVYSAYGIEQLDKRVTNGNYNQLDRHLQRFRMACNAAKSRGIDIWVIAFATTLTADMTNCASKPAQAAGLSTNAQLIAKFQEIGSKIGSLRLSQ